MSKISISAKQFLKLSTKRKIAVLYELDSEELIKLYEFLIDYTSTNGINDGLRYIMDTTFNLGCLRCIEEGNLDLSLINQSSNS